ncbi:MAG TPA: GNAT family N-acetyltransferase [Iamia sp.]
MTDSPGPAPPAIATSLGNLSWRPRTEEDQGLLRALFAASRRAELGLMAGDPDQERAFVDLQLRAREQHRDATRPGADLAIVTLDDVAIGQLDLHRAEGHLEVLEIALVPGLQGHGLGTAVLHGVLAEADEAELPVVLHVEPANPARRLYERLGFVVRSTGGTHLEMERPAPGAATGPRPAPPAAEETEEETATDGVDALPVDLPPLPTYDDLAPHIGVTVACLPDGPDLELVTVEARTRPGRTGPVPYSALLAGPLDRPLEQGMHRLDLPGTGPIELFIVPITPVDGRAVYELIVT